MAEITIDVSSFSSSSKDDMLRQEMNKGEENENNQLHRRETRIDVTSPALDSGDDGSRPTTNEGEENENNQLEEEKVREVPIAETKECTSSNQDESSLPLWVSEIEEEITEPQNNQSQMPKIPMVPTELLGERTKEFYHPLAVSIGPYHYSARMTTLGQVEKLKLPMMHQFVQDSKRTMVEVYRVVQKEARDARGSYCKTKTENFSDEDFTKMMIIDGCFILQFIHCLENKEYEKLKMTDQQIANVQRDLLLLENQLPLSLLESLMSLRFETEDEVKRIINYFPSSHIRQPIHKIPKWVWIFTPIVVLLSVLLLPLYCIIYYCCCCLECLESALDLLEFLLLLIFPTYGKKATADDERPAHLLEDLYSKFLNIQQGKRTKHPPGRRGQYLYYSAKNLKKVGIQFRPNQTGALTDVKFKSSCFCGTLILPPITLNASTKSMLLNLVAYEACADLRRWVTSYICFMDSLIDDAEDVEELRSNGILFNYLGSNQQVADLFNEMSHSMEPDAAAYNDIERAINKQCETIIMRWVSEWKRTYFRSPWTVITVLAASLGLALTATQTYYAIQEKK